MKVQKVITVIATIMIIIKFLVSVIAIEIMIEVIFYSFQAFLKLGFYIIMRK